jgi:outer membrane protein TolC
MDEPDSSSDVIAVSHQLSERAAFDESQDIDDPFQQATAFPLDGFVTAVLARNQSLASVEAEWGAAAQRYPQAIAFEDPLLQSMYAPQSFSSSSNVQSSYYLGVAQKIPWAGKRGLRGQRVQWEASAALYDVDAIRIGLTEAARVAYIDYYLNQQLLDLNTANMEATEQFREIARAKFEGNQVSQQDVLQADVELKQLQQRRIELLQERQVAIARINTLLHRRPDHWLPPPPPTVSTVTELPDSAAFRELAVGRRPELQALSARVQAELTAVQLAYKEFYPDFELMGRYDRFWTDVEQRPQIGLNVNIPLNQSRRRAAVQEALFRAQKMQADYQLQIDTILNDVQAAHARVQGGLKTVALYEDEILPLALDNLSAARAGYTAGTLDFLRLIEAQRQVIDVQEKHQVAVAELHRRWAELDRAAGGMGLDTIETIPNAPAVIPQMDE